MAASFGYPLLLLTLLLALYSLACIVLDVAAALDFEGARSSLAWAGVGAAAGALVLGMGGLSWTLRRARRRHTRPSLPALIASATLFLAPHFLLCALSLAITLLPADLLDASSPSLNAARRCTWGIDILWSWGAGARLCGDDGGQSRAGWIAAAAARLAIFGVLGAAWAVMVFRLRRGDYEEGGRDEEKAVLHHSRTVSTDRRSDGFLASPFPGSLPSALRPGSGARTSYSSSTYPAGAGGDKLPPMPSRFREASSDAEARRSFPGWGAGYGYSYDDGARGRARGEAQDHAQGEVGGWGTWWEWATGQHAEPGPSDVERAEELGRRPPGRDGRLEQQSSGSLVGWLFSSVLGATHPDGSTAEPASASSARGHAKKDSLTAMPARVSPRLRSSEQQQAYSRANAHDPDDLAHATYPAGRDKKRHRKVSDDSMKRDLLLSASPAITGPSSSRSSWIHSPPSTLEGGDDGWDAPPTSPPRSPPRESMEDARPRSFADLNPQAALYDRPINPVERDEGGGRREDDRRLATGGPPTPPEKDPSTPSTAEQPPPQEERPLPEPATKPRVFIRMWDGQLVRKLSTLYSEGSRERDASGERSRSGTSMSFADEFGFAGSRRASESLGRASGSLRRASGSNSGTGSGSGSNSRPGSAPGITVDTASPTLSAGADLRRNDTVLSSYSPSVVSDFDRLMGRRPGPGERGLGEGDGLHARDESEQEMLRSEEGSALGVDEEGALAPPPDRARTGSASSGGPGWFQRAQWWS